MHSVNKSTFLARDVTLLLTDITGKIRPLATEEREKLMQSGVHYSEMLPLEYKPSERYISEYYYALNSFANETARAVMVLADKIYSEKQENIVLVSLARAGTPIGILLKRYLCKKYNLRTIKIETGSFFPNRAKKLSIASASSSRIINIKPLYCLHKAFTFASFIKSSIIYLKYKFVVLNSIL